MHYLGGHKSVSKPLYLSVYTRLSLLSSNHCRREEGSTGNLAVVWHVAQLWDIVCMKAHNSTEYMHIPAVMIRCVWKICWHPKGTVVLSPTPLSLHADLTWRTHKQPSSLLHYLCFYYHHLLSPTHLGHSYCITSSLVRIVPAFAIC